MIKVGEVQMKVKSAKELLRCMMYRGKKTSWVVYSVWAVQLTAQVWERPRQNSGLRIDGGTSSYMQVMYR